MNNLSLQFNFSFEDLHSTAKLKELDLYFLNYIKSLDIELYNQLILERKTFKSWSKHHSQIAIALAYYLELFIADFFKISSELELEKEKYPSLAQIYECKRLFVQRHALKSNKLPINTIEQLSEYISLDLKNYSLEYFEQIFSEFVLKWLKEKDQTKLDIATEYALWAVITDEGIIKHKNGILFKIPQKIDHSKLLNLEEKIIDNLKSYNVPKDKLHQRNGFKLTDKGCNLNFAIDQSNYCIHCHNQEKDSCSKGTKEESNGCPLDEKISEMNHLKSKANVIGSLAMAIIDNPMLAATGHRICNDCMKACIYQKQQPVDIPQIETRVLKDVLDLPWGFEIYSLLTRWNPLSFASPYPRDDTGAKTLVVGMGPAGFTLAHYLLNEGHIVVGIDGLKIEPLDNNLLSPIKNINQIFQELDERVIGGFGGVMEYGITNRWNKNFLLLIRLLLERRSNFKLYGGVRLGSNITPKQAFNLGFQHIALALGAGSPKLLSTKDTMARGVKTASDFLMSLQLGKAYKNDSLTNLQIRMPIVVIGGGLTALDTATEALAYYPQLVNKFAKNYDSSLNLLDEDKIIAEEFLDHNKLFESSSLPLSVMQSLGGVKILYRNKITKAPSYRLNHEELNLGLQEGVEFVEETVPTKIILDGYGHVCAIECIQTIDNIETKLTIPAKTILIAAGTTPNTILSKEFPEVLGLEGKYFKQVAGKFITYKDNNKSISFLGDLHPDYAGNVVKAMASAKHSYLEISKLLLQETEVDVQAFFRILDEQLISVLEEINRLTSNIVELVIKSPMAAANFKPGQFFKLQNYYSSKLPLIEPIALTGAKVDQDKGTISTIILEMGKSSHLCHQLELNKSLVFMGPTGTATDITPNKKIMLIGGGLGNAVLFSIGQALRSANSEVIYFAGYRKLQDRYKIEEIEAAADQIIWSCDEGVLESTRDQDESFHGNIIQSILNFSQKHPDKLKIIDQIIVIGSDKMMHAVKTARETILKPFLNDNHIAIASINSPMQCMMKEICGQCLQKHIDPNTGEETYIFSCVTQDQNLDRVDFYHLADRLKQNQLLEKLP